MRPGDRRVLSGALGPFPCALGVVRMVCVRSVHSRTPWGSLLSIGSVRSIPVLPGGRRVRSCAFGLFSAHWGSFWCVRSIPVRPGYRRVHSVHFVHPGVSSGAFVPFISALAVLGLVPARSVHSRAP